MILNKKEIRKKIIDVRNNINSAEKILKDSMITEKLISSRFYKSSNTIFAFVNFGSEVDTRKFIEQSIKDNKIICVPKVISKEKGMELFVIESLEDLEPGFYGIMEPKKNCPSIDKSKLDFVLMPGVAFDRRGGRIGYGAGFYDRFLTDLNPSVPRIAIAYQLQIIDEVPMEESDIRIDGIITEEETILFN